MLLGVGGGGCLEHGARDSSCDGAVMGTAMGPVQSIGDWARGGPKGVWVWVGCVGSERETDLYPCLDCLSWNYKVSVPHRLVLLKMFIQTWISNNTQPKHSFTPLTTTTPLNNN